MRTKWESRALERMVPRGRRLPGRRLEWEVVGDEFGGRVLFVSSGASEPLEVCGLCFDPDQAGAGVFVDGRCSNCGAWHPEQLKVQQEEKTQQGEKA